MWGQDRHYDLLLQGSAKLGEMKLKPENNALGVVD